LGKEALILGCGFTGRRVARRLLARGWTVTATTRSPERLAALAAGGVKVLPLDVLQPATLERLARLVRPGIVVLHSIPVVTGPGEVPFDPTPQLLDALANRPVRIIYLSTTGVYGAAHFVDETTQPEPRTPRERLRVEAEMAVARGPWSWLVLRPAAIYGPGRGIHESMKRGTFRLNGAGDNWVSRIHVDDLAAHVEAALGSDIQGFYPVADEEPCRSIEIATFCAAHLRIPLPPSAAAAELSETRQANRRVDGSAIRRLLGIRLRYPSYRSGIVACLTASPADAD
jgi:Nucleoside-diphosphate-sugar epimerases